MDALNLDTIADFAGGTLRQGRGETCAADIATDSRAIGCNELFLALRGERFDGHRFVENLTRSQAVGAIVEAGAVRGKMPADFALIEVTDTLLAYQQIAARYRRTLPMKLIAVTGSNGKTSTKDLTAAVLSSRYRVLKTSGNFNNHVGVPRTLLQASATDEIAVLEIGMNHPGEIAPLASVAAPDVAIITNIGTAHIEFMKTRAAIAQEKGELAAAVSASGYVVLPAEDEFFSQLAGRTAATKITVGFKQGDIRAENLSHTAAGTDFTLVAEGSRWDVHLSIPGKHMVLNALLALATARVYGLGWDECISSLSKAVLTKGRLERKSVGGLNILDDTYNANPDSVVAALETLTRIPTDGRRIAVLGRMGELGAESVPGHRRVGEAAVHFQVDQVICVGPEAEHIARGIADADLPKVELVTSVADAAGWLNEYAQSDDLILLKGSRSAGLEGILPLLNPRPTASMS